MNRISSEILDRLPPQSLDDERRVLASIIILPSCFDDVREILNADDFYAESHQRMFRAMIGLAASGKPIEPELLVDWLKTSGELEAVGGYAYIGEVLSSSATAASVAHYSAIVAKKSQLRSIIQIGTEMLQDCWDPAADPALVVNAAEAGLSRVANNEHGVGLVDIQTAVMTAMDRIGNMLDRGESAGMFTGLDEFDTKIGGLFPGELTVLSARSGVGKSAIACQFVAHNATRDRLCYIASLEMDAGELATRMLCTDADVDGRKIRTNTLSDEDYDRLMLSATEVSKRAVRFDERPQLTVGDIRRAARRLLREGLRLVVVDYLQILTPSGDDESRERQVARMSQDLKALARELKLPVLVLCQSNRDAEKDKSVSLRHLRESDAIGQNADVVLILECGAIGTDKAREAWLTIAKNRNGPKGKLQLDWCPERTEFTCHIKQAAEMANYEPAFHNDF